jgi:hypothetical protein
MEQNRRQAIEATLSAAAASLLPHSATEANGDHVILTPETHAPCRVFDANGTPLGVECIWANTATGEARHFATSESGGFKWQVAGSHGEKKLVVPIETRWHPAPLRWEPLPDEIPGPHFVGWRPTMFGLIGVVCWESEQQ